MIVTLCKSFKFDAAHHLDFLPDGHKCRRMHGHTYQVYVSLRGEAPDGFMIDYADVAAIVQPVVDLVDHRELNQVDGLEIPTTETLVWWFIHRLSKPFKANDLLHQLGVRVYESDTTYCEAHLDLKSFTGRGM